jgi:hypothetical protein
VAKIYQSRPGQLFYLFLPSTTYSQKSRRNRAARISKRLSITTRDSTLAVPFNIHRFRKSGQSVS